MLWQIIALLGGCGVFGVALWLASENGSKAAQLESLKAEIKKQAEEEKRAQKIADTVVTMDEPAVRQRLHKIANRER